MQLEKSITKPRYSNASFFFIFKSWQVNKIKIKKWLDLRICFFVVQLLSCVGLFVTPCTVACQASLSFTISQRLLRFMSIESVMPSNHLISCLAFFPRPLLNITPWTFSPSFNYVLFTNLLLTTQAVPVWNEPLIWLTVNPPSLLLIRQHILVSFF